MTTNNDIVQIKKATEVCSFCHAKDVCMSSFLSKADYRLFDRVVGHRSLMNRGERIYMAGDRLTSIFILHSGSVKTYVESTDGDIQITGFYLPGDLIGIHGIEQGIHTDSVEALETSSVCELQFQSFDDLLATFPTMHKPLCARVFQELNHEQSMLLILGKMSAERRMAHFLLDLSKRMAEHGRSPNHIALTMTRHDIGNYLGLAVETVSRLLTRLQNQGIIEVQRRTILLEDIEELQAISEHTAESPEAHTHSHTR